MSPSFDGATESASKETPDVAADETHQITEEFLKWYFSCLHALMYSTCTFKANIFQIYGLKVVAKGYFRTSLFGAAR
ncbi:uncharacterized protein BDCG_16543 [Blastomyces dermatitidis ER-3]|uniref:Uncharacterized protein n=2 Tax=Ajellomyces dermatitidis TaxID=5039 RepID=A0A0J9HGR1_AJEDA|nr:uncharacterized protein BDCG_16543 [Blastomyces dermatitidis ER-3]EQL35230.1 hypothetical protein BDFG_02985 [Blastomyces dermatitidis ATCC 26199]KMW68299.1 hypothetical protein BDDG_12722 [Blastomyces dermatitidis ATCC 18188]OAT00244.1 hypothetical protein BDCG_16543 [Blastomyces dermatitidis ER-3]